MPDRASLVKRHNEMSHDLLTLPWPSTLGGFISARRMVLGLEQAELAKAIGVRTSSIISLYEANKRMPPLKKLKHLAKALKVDVQTLIDFVVK